MSVVVVTGATGAAGTATCAALLVAGHRVVAVGSNAERLRAVPASSRQACDLTDAAQTPELATRVRAEEGGVDALVHLVGGWRAGHEALDWDWLEARILTTLRLTTLAFADDLAASDSGRLMTIGSVTASQPTWSGANYSVLKTAASAWVASIASGWRKAGTGAALELLVRSIGPDGTPVETIARRIVDAMDGDPAELNGARIDLTV